MKSADKVQRLLRRAGVTTHSATDDAVFENLKTAYIQTRSAQQEPSLWRFVMKSPLAKLAVAATVLIACLIGLFFWRTTGSGIALADVLARAEKVKAVRYKWTYTFSGYAGPNKPYNQEIRATSLNSGEYGTRSTWEWLDPNGGESGFSEEYFLPQEKTTIFISPTQKTYRRRVLPEAQVEQMQKANPDIKDPLAYLRKILKTKYESLGRSTVDGLEVAGFRTTDPNLWGGKNPQTDAKLWVDVKTLLPVRYDLLASVEVDEMGDRLNHHFVTHEFQWDVSVDPAAFEPPAIPDGYTVLVEKPLGVINEQTVIESLRQCAELLGKYPESLSAALSTGLQSELDRSDSPAATRLKEDMKGLAEQERANRLADAGMPMRRLFNFYLRLIEGRKDPAYHGKTVTPKDASKVLLRWKVSDKEYRVIFGDLHAETVSSERLGELEKVPPK